MIDILMYSWNFIVKIVTIWSLGLVRIVIKFYLNQCICKKFIPTLEFRIDCSMENQSFNLCLYLSCYVSFLLFGNASHLSIPYMWSL